MIDDVRVIGILFHKILVIGFRIVELVERDDLRDLYDSWGATMRKRGAGWQVALVTNDLTLAGRIHVPFTELLRTTNGGVPVRFVRGSVGGSASRAVEG